MTALSSHFLIPNRKKEKQKTVRYHTDIWTYFWDAVSYSA